MNRIAFIAIAFLLIVTESFAQSTKVDTLYVGFNEASALTVTNNAIYVVESGVHRVLKLSLQGNLIEKYGNRGSSNYQFDRPQDIATTNGLKIFVSDPGNNRIQVFDKRWQYLSSITGNGKFRTSEEITPEYLAVNKIGEVFFIDKRSSSISKYDENGTYLDQIPIPSEIRDVSRLQLTDSKIFLLDKRSGVIHRLSENGFYETFYEGKETTTFFFSDESLYRVNGTVVEMDNRQQVNTILSLEKGIKVKDIIVVEDVIYILSSNTLIKIQRK
ncbi:MAG: hypothetical protein JXR20_10445 [Balneola sp.]